MLHRSDAHYNLLLASLSAADFDLIAPHLQTRSFKPAAVLFEPNDGHHSVYFLLSGMVSLLTVMRDGASIETAAVGREGIAGAMALSDPSTHYVRAVVLLPATMAVLSLDLFQAAMTKSAAFRDVFIRYNESLLAQTRITSACNALHPINMRVCRALLRSAERAESDEVTLTQELLSDVLGIRRTSVTEVAQDLKRQGIISYQRGKIDIIDREALRARCCECHELHIEQFAATPAQPHAEQRAQHARMTDTIVTRKPMHVD